MEAWRTSCPRLPIWEDSVDLGFVRREGHMVMLTDAGRRRLGSGA
jgi:D-3-phosphoglycerate dehydrogenase